MGLFRDWLSEARLPVDGDYRVLPGFKFGVEVEGFLPKTVTWDDLAEKLNDRWWQIGRDTSLELISKKEQDTFQHEGYEIRGRGDGIPSESIGEALDSLKGLEELGFYLNRTAGIHVHVSHGGFDDPDRFPLSVMMNLVSLFDEPGILKLLKHRRRTGYADSSRRFVTKLLADPYLRENPGELKSAMFNLARYSSINFASLSRLGTVEFRLFGALGKLNVDKHVRRWVGYLSNVFKKALEEPYIHGSFMVSGDKIYLPSGGKSIESEGGPQKGIKELEKRLKEVLNKHTKMVSKDEPLDGGSITRTFGVLSREGLEEIMEIIGRSRIRLEEFTFLASARDILFNPSTDQDRELLMKFFDLYLRHKEFQLLFVWCWPNFKQENFVEAFQDWVTSRKSYAKDFSDHLIREFDNISIISGPPMSVLKGLVAGNEPLPDNSLDNAYEIAAFMLKDLELIKLEGWETLEKLIEEIGRSSREDLSRSIASLKYKALYGRKIDPLKEKEERLKTKRLADSIYKGAVPYEDI